jgi:hypothetical protein
LDSSEFVVLLPQISLEDFGCSQEPQDCSIALGQSSIFFLPPFAASGHQICLPRIGSLTAIIGTLLQNLRCKISGVAPIV